MQIRGGGDFQAVFRPELEQIKRMLLSETARFGKQQKILVTTEN